jgi:NAD+ synthase (glutamine-hydrolysing)
MWNWANSAKGMWLQTGNMSEKAVGYTTVGGDLMGAYSLIGNLPKTMVITLLEHLYKKHRWPAVGELLATKASAELAEGQEDEKDLMPFPVLDACFALFAGEKLMPVDLYRRIRSMWTDEDLAVLRPDYRKGMLKVWVKRFLRLFVGSIFKWVQAPQTVHLGSLDLDRERALQLPVVQSMEWLDVDAIDGLPD